MFNLRVILRDWLNKRTPEELARSKAFMEEWTRSTNESFERLRRSTEHLDEWRRSIAASSGLSQPD